MQKKATNPLPKRNAPAVDETAFSVCDWQEVNGPKRQRQASLFNFFGQPSTNTKRSVAVVSPEQKNIALGVYAKNKKKQKVSHQESSKKSEQLYLDVGQASFGRRTECPHCGTLYEQGVTQDVEAHQRVCQNFTAGVFIKMTPELRASKHVVPLNSTDTFIVEVRKSWSDCVQTFYIMVNQQA